LEKVQSIAYVILQVSTVEAHKLIISTNIIYYIIIRNIVNHFGNEIPSGIEALEIKYFKDESISICIV